MEKILSLQKIDEEHMREALLLAKVSASKNEVPIGAVIVSSYGETIGSGYNLVENFQCQNGHAEVMAIKDACRQIKNWRLVGCTLYSTLEPCTMCVSLCILSRIERIVYAAKSPVFGYTLDKYKTIPLYTSQFKNITSGILEKESKSLLKGFFKLKRKQKIQFYGVNNEKNE